jgi:predicted lipoprotein with Yx(FWY)xxD motif
MRKSGWAAAGLGSLVLLLAACGTSSNSTTGASGGSPAGSPSSQASGASPGSSGQAASSSPASSASSKGSGTTTHPSAGASHHTAGPQPSGGNQVSFPPQGTTFMIVLHTKLGYVLGLANDEVVYTYAKDKPGGSPQCVGACATTWPPVTGTPKAGPADHFPGTFAVVRGSGGVEQVTYQGMPLYLFKGAKPFSVAGNGVGGLWHVVPLSASDIGA